jgi:hypothetical protein
VRGVPGGGWGYVALAAWRPDTAARGAAAAAVGDLQALARVSLQPHVVFLSTAVGDTHGKVSVAPLDAPHGPRYATSLECARVYFIAGEGLCLGNNVVGGFDSAYSAYTFAGRYDVRQTFQQAGVPSRVCLSPDGRRGALTVFVSGHSYAEGGFSTLTSIVDTATGAVLADLEQFTISRDGVPISAPDLNFWGVTFARDNNCFYATLGTGGKTYLLEGDLAARTARIIHEGVECPSLSPDNTRIAFNKQVGIGGRIEWRPYVLDLATLTETALGETRNVDDQIEWLDDQHVVYARADSGPARTTATAIWVLPVDGSAPRACSSPRATPPQSCATSPSARFAGPAWPRAARPSLRPACGRMRSADSASLGEQRRAPLALHVLAQRIASAGEVRDQAQLLATRQVQHREPGQQRAATGMLQALGVETGEGAGGRLQWIAQARTDVRLR